VRLLVAASVGILLIALASGLFSYAQIFITSSIGYRMVYALRRELFAHLQTLSLSFHTQSRSGDLLTKIAGDTNTLKDIFADSILKFTTYVLTVAGMFAVMFALNWQIGLISLATVRESIRVARLEAAATRSSEIITAVGTAAAVSFVALLVLKHKMLPGELTVVVGYLTNMYKPMRSLAKLSTDFSKAMARNRST